MESIGEKLKTAREEKGYSPDQVARDTNIARRFILAMENEDFEVFPGDTYLIGFLRNYADYLGLDPNRIINLYRNMKIQEQPIPMEALIRGRRKGPGGKLILFVLSGLLVLSGAGYGIYTLLQGTPETEAQLVQEEASPEAESDIENAYEMSEEIVARRFRNGQSVIVHMSEGKIPVTIEGIEDKVTLKSPAGSNDIRLGESLSLDLTLDGVEDLLVEVQDIDRSGETAVIRFDRGVGRRTETQETAAIETGETDTTEEAGEIAETAGAVEYIGTAAEGREVSEQVILSADNVEAFRLSVVFRGYSLVRYLKDNQIREQRYFNKDDTFQLDVNREVMLWISNAGSFQAQIAGRELSFGNPGEVSARIIRWEQEEDSGRYQLKMLPVY